MSTDILLIDLSSIAHQAWHTCGDDPNPDAASIKTIARVRSLASGKPHVGICLDTPPYFRKDIDPDYKANRAKDNNAVIAHQIAMAVDVLKEDYCILGAKGYEADDIIATAVHEVLTYQWSDPVSLGADGSAVLGKPYSRSVTIASADKDLLQLVSDRVTVLSTSTGNLVDPDAVKEKLGVWPHQMVDYLCLVGDTSDNIAGAKGVGKVTAAEILETFGNLDDAMKNAAEVQPDAKGKLPAVTRSLVEFAPRLETVRSLIRLRTDAPIAFDDIFKERHVHERRDVLDSEGLEADTQEAETVSGQVDAPQSAAVVPPVGPPTIQRDGPDRAHSGELQQAMNPSGLGPSGIQMTAKPKPDGPPESTALVTVEWNQQLEPSNVRQAAWFAEKLFASRLFSNFGSPEQILAIILAGRDFGMSMSKSLRGFDNINGKPAMKADLIRGLVLSSGKVEYFEPVERTDERCTFAIKRNGRPEVRMTYTIEEARKAWKKDQRAWDTSNYATIPADMLVARCSSKLGRLVCPDVCHGLYAEEELG